MTQPVYPCPRCGQASSESDFCSECGARIEAGTALPASALPSSAVVTPSGTPTGVDECPECHTPRLTTNTRFCEVCRYDFVAQAAGGPPVVTPVAPVADPAGSATPIPDPLATTISGSSPPADPATQATSAPAPNGVRWDVVVAVDPSLDTDPEPDLKAPEDPERRIPLDKGENLIGRRDATQPFVPDVRPHDPSVSRRHAKLLVHADGTVAILDLESANGTFVNGEQILAGVPHPLAPGDVVTMGRWTSLRIDPRSTP
jgi:FHA domain-containing protein/double zinc ribbon protein